MTLPFQTKPYLPRVRLYRDDGSNYDYHPLNNTFDFIIRKLDFRPVFDGLAGRFTMTLTSQNASLSGMRTILSEVSEGNEVLISVGKTLAGITDVYRGVIESTEITEENPKWMDIEMTGIDWGSLLLKGLRVNNAVIQKKQSDGVTPDNTDTNSKLKQIATDMCTSDAWYAASGSPITAEDIGLVVDSANLNYPDINIAQFQSNLETLDDKLSELDNFAYTYHYVDPNKNLIVKTIGSEAVAKVLLASDNKDDTLFSSWASGWATVLVKTNKIKRTLEDHAVRIYGLGGDELVVDQKQETDTTETETGTQFLAQKFTPLANYLEYCEIKISKEGSLSSDIVILIKEDLNGEPKGETLATLKKPASAVTGSADWHPFQSNVELNTAKDYWIVLEKQTDYDASNNIHWRRDTATNNTNASSSDGSTWTVNSSSYGFCFRTKYTTPLIHMFPLDGSVTASSKHFVEAVISKPDITHRDTLQRLIQAEASTLLKKKQVWNGYVYVPDNVPIAGQKVRVRKTLGGYQIDTDGTANNPHFILSTPAYHFEDSQAEQRGVLYLNLTGARFLTV